VNIDGGVSAGLGTIDRENREFLDLALVVIQPPPSPDSYVERQNLTLRMTQKRFARLTNGFSKKLTNHAAAVSLYVTHYNLCRVHEALRTTPGVALGIVDNSTRLRSRDLVNKSEVR